MKTLKISLVAASLLVAFLLIFSACTKTGIDTSAGGKVSVFLTDGPGEFDSVFIDIQKVEVKIDTNSVYKDKDDRCDDDDDRDDDQKRKDEYGEWVNINFTPAIIDVLSLRNGVETKLGEANILTGTVRKIRITLGTQNRVVKNGVSSTSIAVKMSMAISLIIIIIAYNESLSFFKIAGILCAFIGVFLVTHEKQTERKETSFLWMLIVLFLGSGLLDFLLNYVQKYELTQLPSSLFSAIGFGLAGLIGLGILIAQIIRRKTRIEFRNVIGGVILGVPNFFSIFLLMRAYNSVTWSDSSVLAVINVAIVCISTFLGTLIFSEKISWAKGLGLCCSLLAIYLFYLVN